MKNKGGFTLIELLLVIGIIAVLAVVVFVALDPAKRFQDARNARRISDIQSILNAVQQYTVDNKGQFPTSLTEAEEQVIGTSSAGCLNTNGGCSASDTCVDLSGDLERYLKTIPYDPQDGSSGNTYYTILKENNGIVTVRACEAEGSEISVSG